MGNFIDLAGQVFGRWTVIQKAESKHGQTMWLCKCICGEEGTINGYTLVHRVSTSCGCHRIQLIKSRAVDITGQVFGRWTALKEFGYTNTGRKRKPLWLCRCECGTERVILRESLRAGTSKSCGCLRDELALARNGDKSSNWQGGRFKDNNGYILVHKPDHPNANKRYVLEHIFVMSEILGRPLQKGETVHHKNGVRDDNDPSNLELWADRHPGGQRVEDLIAFAKEILNKYEPIVEKL